VAEHRRLVQACLEAERAGDLLTAREGLGRLIDLAREIERGEEDIVFFADDGGAARLRVSWERVLPAWFRSLGPEIDAYAWAETVVEALDDFVEWHRREPMLSRPRPSRRCSCRWSAPTCRRSRSGGRWSCSTSTPPTTKPTASSSWPSWMARAKRRCEATQERARVFGDFRYAAKTWGRSRRVIVKAEHSLMGPNPRFVATTSTRSTSAVRSRMPSRSSFHAHQLSVVALNPRRRA